MSAGLFATPYIGKPGTREQITPGDTSTGITTAIRAPITSNFKGKTAKGALIQNTTQNEAKFTLDGTAPTANAGTNIGFLLEGYGAFVIIGKDAVANFRCIDYVSGSASTIEVLCYF